MPARARSLRVVLLELERLYNHTADIGALATDVAFTVPASRAQALREGLVRLQDHCSARDCCGGRSPLGGVTRDLPPRVVRCASRAPAWVREAVRRTDPLLVDAGTFTDRVDGTGVLSQQAARDLGIVGMAARASGVDGDLRRDHPNDAYEGLRFEVPVEEGGDVRARLMVRAREIEQSLVILQQVLGALPDTPLAAPLPDRLPASSGALGWVEAWRGPCTHWVATDDRGEICARQDHRPELSELAWAHSGCPGQHHPGFSCDQ